MRIKKGFDKGDIPKTPMVLGYDEIKKLWQIVRYCDQSHRFFDVETNAVFPIERMHFWKYLET